MQVLSIGRDKSNHIVLNDAMVSRKHAELTIQNNGTASIKDLGSSNGLFVNGSRVSEAILRPGDVVKCGPIFLNWSQYLPTISQSYEQREEQRPQYQHQAQVQPVSTNTPNANPQNVSQTIVISNQSKKSTGVAFILAFLFGPLGLLYASILGGFIMFFITLISWFVLPLIGAIFCWVGCIIWAIVAVNQHNQKAPQIQHV